MKRRKIKIERLLLVIAVIVLIISAMIFTIRKTLTYIESKQREARENITVNLTKDGYEYVLNYDEYLDYEKTHILPDRCIEEYEVYQNELAQQDLAGRLAAENQKTYTLLGSFKLTGYCDCKECQEQWVGTTASGITPTANHTIAVDPEVIQLGSHVMINGIEYVAEDVGGMIKGNRIDIFVDSHEETFLDEYNCYADVYLIIDGE